MLWIKDCGAHFNHFRIVKRRIEEDQINNGGNGMTPSAIVTDEIGSIDLILKVKGLKMMICIYLKTLANLSMQLSLVTIALLFKPMAIVAKLH